MTDISKTSYDPEKWARQFGVDCAVAVAELPDRTSPDDQPEMMLVTASELSQIIEARLLPELETAFDSGKDEIDTTLGDENERLRHALEESVKLQSHYAMLLNDYDGGRRMIFKNGAAWMKRLKEIAI